MVAGTLKWFLGSLIVFGIGSFMMGFYVGGLRFHWLLGVGFILGGVALYFLFGIYGDLLELINEKKNENKQD